MNDANDLKVLAFNSHTIFHLLWTQLDWLVHEEVYQLGPSDDIDQDMKLGIL